MNLEYSNDESIETITLDLKSILEKMILKNPDNGFGLIIVGNKLILLFFSFF